MNLGDIDFAHSIETQCDEIINEAAFLFPGIIFLIFVISRMV